MTPLNLNHLNQNPEQQARDTIDAMLVASGWIVQGKKAQNRQAGPGKRTQEISLVKFRVGTGRSVSVVCSEKVDKRERLTRKKFWATVDEEIEYSGKQLDKDIVNPSSIRTVVQNIRYNLPATFPDRYDAHERWGVSENTSLSFLQAVRGCYNELGLLYKVYNWPRYYVKMFRRRLLMGSYHKTCGNYVFEF